VCEVNWRPERIVLRFRVKLLPKFGSSNRQDAEDAKQNTKIIVAGLSPER
jgi:hypothetical protein